MLIVIIPYFTPSVLKKINKCSGNCNNINSSYAEICVPAVIKDLNVKVFNLMSRTNDAIVCNNKQRWNKNKCRCVDVM